jgi:hypothetical protein
MMAVAIGYRRWMPNAMVGLPQDAGELGSNDPRWVSRRNAAEIWCDNAGVRGESAVLNWLLVEGKRGRGEVIAEGDYSAP